MRKNRKCFAFSYLYSKLHNNAQCINKNPINCYPLYTIMYVLHLTIFRLIYVSIVTTNFVYNLGVQVIIQQNATIRIYRIRIKFAGSYFELHLFSLQLLFFILIILLYSYQFSIELFSWMFLHFISNAVFTAYVYVLSYEAKNLFVCIIL